MFKPIDYTANYFSIAKKIIKKYKPNSIVTLQFFQRNNNVLLAGINEVLKFLQKNTVIDLYEIKYLTEGTVVNKNQVVLQLKGKYEYFGIYEGLIDGILARQTSIATNAMYCIQAAPTKSIVYMGDRSDHYRNQIGDGEAVRVASLNSFSTNAHANGDEKKVYGSIPHVLIQAFHGDLVTVMNHYAELYPKENNFIALVDFNNDVISDSLLILKAFGTKLKSVRVDTSQAIKDKMFGPDDQEYGVTVNQIKKLKLALCANKGEHVKITVSSGFDPEKIAKFEVANTPVDAYGVGEYIQKIWIYFTADSVEIDGNKIAKVGRSYQSSDNLKLWQK